MGKKQVMKVGIFIIVLFLIPLVSAGLGSVQADTCMNIRVLANCSSVNLSEVSIKDTTFIINKVMDHPGGQTHNYTFCNTTSLGIYSYSWDNPCIDCSEGDCGNSFEVTYDGNVLSIEKSILYIGLILILIFLFLLVIFNIGKLPTGNQVNDEGYILSIDNLKYFRPVLWAFSWGLLLGILFLTANISIAHLPTQMFGSFFFALYQVMMWMTLPATVVWFLYIITKLFRDKEMKNMIERGVQFKGSREM